MYVSRKKGGNLGTRQGIKRISACIFLSGVQRGNPEKTVGAMG